MKVSSSNTTEKIELNKKEQTVNEECLCPCDMNFKEMLTPRGSFSESNLVSSVSSEDTLLVSSDLKAAFNYDTFSMDKDDAKFFIDMVNNGQFALNLQGDVNAAVLNMSDESSSVAKSSNVSKTLVNLIENSYNTQKPVRIDFDNNVSVVLKVDKQGKVSAEFIPGDKAVEQYLRDNIGFLKQRFDEQNLPYNDLMYRQHKKQNQNQKRNNKGE